MADRVLITTDDLEHAVRVNAHLETAGFQTTLASSFDDVRRVVGTGAATPDCIVLTGALHESSAAQLLRIAHDRSISTLGLVEQTEPDPKALARELGLTAFLEKPADPAEVTATVRRLIEGRRLGRFELAEGGTIFLDEVAECPPATQVKLLRVLEDRSFFRVGGTQAIKVDVRVTAATNKSLKEEVALGRFRDDLFYRLNVLHIALAPLRERKTDIPLLVRRFIAEFAGLDDRVPQRVEVIEVGPGSSVAPVAPPVEAEPAPEGDVVYRPGMTMADVERAAIEAVLRQTKGNRRKAAEVLGIGERTLYRKLKEYQLA